MSVIAPPVKSFYFTGGTLPADALSYVERQADRDLLGALRAGEYRYVLNSRQMGKSSLCVRTMGRLHEEGIHTAFLDLTKFGGRNLTAEQWYAALLADLGRELGLRAECLRYWKENPELPPVQRLFGAITEVALPQLDERRTTNDERGKSPLLVGGHLSLVVFIDEIDVTRSLPFNTDEFFAAIRRCYVGRATEAALKGVAFCLLGTATPAELIEDTRVSPFNIGRRIEVQDFTAEEAGPLAWGLVAGSAGVPPACPTTGQATTGHAGGTPALPATDAQRLLARILYWTAGHPYLTQRLCRAIAEEQGRQPQSSLQNPKSVDGLCSALFLTHTAKEGDDNLALVRNRLLKSDADLASLLELYGKLRAGKEVADDETNALCGVLKLSGVAKVEAGRLRVRNRIYGAVFDRGWVAQHMPDAEARRQKAAFRRGLARATAVAGVIIAVMAGLVLTAVNEARRADRNAGRADQQRRLAEEQKVTLRRNLYAADVNLAQQGWETGNLGRARELLDAHRPERGQEELRGFEWRYLWRLCQGDALCTFSGDQSWVFSVAFSPDGKTLAADGTNGAVMLWDVAKRQELAKLSGQGDGVRALSFSPDGKILAHTNRSGFTLWDVATRRMRATRQGHQGAVWTVAFSRDGKTLATGSADTTVKLWDVVSATSGSSEQVRELVTLKGHQAMVRSVAFSPDGETLATGSFDGTARLWDLTTRKAIATLQSHKPVPSVAFSPNGRTLATGGGDGTVTLWDLASATSRAGAHAGEVTTLQGQAGTVMSVAFSPDGKTLASGGLDRTLRLWDVATRRQVASLNGHQDGIWCVSYSPDGKLLATGSHDSTVKLWSAIPKREFTVLRGYQGEVLSVAFLPDGKTLATRSGFPSERDRPDQVKLWDIVAKREMANLEVRPGGGVMAFSPDGKLVAASHGWPEAAALPLAEGSRSRVRLWNVTSKREVGALRGHPNGVKAMAFSPDGKMLATGGADNTIKLWDVASATSGASAYARELVTFKGYTRWPLSVVFSPDGNTLATGGGDGTLKLWNVGARRELATLKGQAGSVMSMAFSSDGRMLATGSNDNHIRLWDLSRPDRVAVLKGHKGWVSSVTFSPDGKALASGSTDETIKLWNVLTGREVLSLKGHQGSVNSVAFSLDGNTLASGSKDQTVRLWRASPFEEVATPEREAQPRSSR